MISVHNNVISLSKGDSAVIAVMFKTDTAVYTPDATDVVLFTAKKDGTEIFNKKITQGIITIQPSDTANMSLGSYDYDVTINQDAIISNGTLTIT